MEKILNILNFVTGDTKRRKVEKAQVNITQAIFIFKIN